MAQGLAKLDNDQSFHGITLKRFRGLLMSPYDEGTRHFSPALTDADPKDWPSCDVDEQGRVYAEQCPPLLLPRMLQRLGKVVSYKVTFKYSEEEEAYLVQTVHGRSLVRQFPLAERRPALCMLFARHTDASIPIYVGETADIETRYRRVEYEEDEASYDFFRSFSVSGLLSAHLEKELALELMILPLAYHKVIEENLLSTFNFMFNKQLNHARRLNIKSLPDFFKDVSDKHTIWKMSSSQEKEKVDKLNLKHYLFKALSWFLSLQMLNACRNAPYICTVCRNVI